MSSRPRVVVIAHRSACNYICRRALRLTVAAHLHRAKAPHYRSNTRLSRRILKPGVSHGVLAAAHNSIIALRSPLLSYLGHITLGWSDAAMIVGARDVGISPSIVGSFPKKEAALVELLDHLRRGCKAGDGMGS